MRHILIIVITLLFLLNCAGNKEYNKEENRNEPEAKDTMIQPVSKYPLIYRPGMGPSYLPSRVYAMKLREYTNTNKLPDCFGGLIGPEDDYHQPVTIYIVGDTIKGRKKMEEILGITEFLIKPAKCSLNQLIETREMLYDLIYGEKKEYNNENYGIMSTILSQLDNCLYVSLEKCDTTMIEKFKRDISDLDCIVFTQWDNSPVPFIIAD